MSTLPPPPLPPPSTTTTTTSTLPPPPIPLGIPPPSVPPSHPAAVAYLPPLNINGVVVIGGPMGSVAAHPMMMQQQQQQMAAMMMAKQHNPTTLILTHVPDFLRYPRNLRDWIYACCGSVKSVAYSCEIKRSYTNHHNSGGGNDDKKEDKDAQSSSSSSNDTKDSVVAVVRMSHSSGAFNLVRNWEPASRRLASPPSSNPPSPHPVRMKAFLLYATNEHSPPFDPLNIPPDAAAVNSIWDGLHGVRPSAEAADESVVTKLVDAYRSIRMRQESSDAGVVVGVDGQTTVLPSLPNGGGGGDAAAAATVISQPLTSATTTTSNTTIIIPNDKKLDVSKVAAAAGGGAYDEEADPLNAPAVLEAVAAFKKKLEESGSLIKRKRAEYVRRRLTEEKKKARARLVEERRVEKERIREEAEGKKREAEAAGTTPLVGGPGGEIMGVVDSGRRGVSNLPSWMTSGGGGAAGSGVGTKRPAEEGGDQGGAPPLPPAPPPLPPSSRDETQPPLPPPLPPSYVSEANRDVNSRKVPRLENMTGGRSMAQIRAENEAADKRKELVSKMKGWGKEEILGEGAVFPPCFVVQGGGDDGVDVEGKKGRIRDFVREQIVEYLGEEEKTLVDFVMNHLGKEGGDCTTGALLEELGVVLEEDAEVFVVDLFKKILED